MDLLYDRRRSSARRRASVADDALQGCAVRAREIAHGYIENTLDSQLAAADLAEFHHRDTELRRAIAHGVRLERRVRNHDSRRILAKQRTSARDLHPRELHVRARAARDAALRECHRDAALRAIVCRYQQPLAGH